jgi:hypothetical protein
MIALMFVRRPDPLGVAVFAADQVEHESGAWTATGRWKYGSGRLSEPATFTWPTARVVEVRWTEVPT